jgi:hypothetical protein
VLWNSRISLCLYPVDTQGARPIPGLAETQLLALRSNCQRSNCQRYNCRRYNFQRYNYQRHNRQRYNCQRYNIACMLYVLVFCLSMYVFNFCYSNRPAYKLIALQLPILNKVLSIYLSNVCSVRSTNHWDCSYYKNSMTYSECIQRILNAER